MKKWQWLLIPIVLLAAWLRLAGVDWDGYEHYHPDERYITWVATSIEAPLTWQSALHVRNSTLNPYYWPAEAATAGVMTPQAEQRDFAYGHLPLYLGVFATRMVERLAPHVGAVTDFSPLLSDLFNSAERIEFDHIVVVGRVLTAFFDLGSIVLVFLIGRQLYSVAVGLLAALFLALNVMHIQLAHFYTFDPYMTFFTLAAIYQMMKAVPQTERPARKRHLYFAAMLVGLAIGSKFSGIMLGLPLLFTVLWCNPDVERGWVYVRKLALIGVLVFGAFAATNPFAVIDFSCDVLLPSYSLGSFEIEPINLGSCFLYNITKQGGMVNGSADFAFTRQYSGTLPYLYYIEMQARWGMGPLLALSAFIGFAWALWQLVSQRRTLLEAHKPLIVVTLWVLPFWLSTGRFFVKFMRYLLPLTPFLMIFAAAMLLSIRWRSIRQIIVTLVVLTTGIYTLSFVNLYAQPHPWVTASWWIYDNVPPDSTILTEQWGDRLPSTLVRDNEVYRARTFGYEQPLLTFLTGVDEKDSAEKLARNIDRLANADYVAIESNRIYGVVPRTPNRYPNSHTVYEALFSGELGYEVAFTVDRTPNLLGVHLQPDYFSWAGLTPPAAVQTYLDDKRMLNGGRADESFTLYDQSLVMIFENVERVSAEKMLEILR